LIKQTSKRAISSHIGVFSFMHSTLIIPITILFKKTTTCVAGEQVTESRLAGTPHGQLEADRLVGLFRDSLDFLLAVGYERVSVEMFHEMVMDLMNDLPKSLEALEEIFADAGESTHLVWYSRVLCAAYLKSNAERFLPFVLDSCNSVEEFCAKNVEPMDRECEEVQVTALAQYFGVPVTIE
jgi:hypothetical protein